MSNINPPSWLKTLNKSAPVAHVEPAAAPSPSQDEHVEPLPVYEAPPPLILNTPTPAAPAVTEPNSNQVDSEQVVSTAHASPDASTALPFAFDAVSFAASAHAAEDKPIQFDSPAPMFGFSMPATVPAELEPGIYAAKLDDNLQVIEPKLIAPPPEWLKPEYVVNKDDPVPVTTPWLANMSTADVINFDNHIQAVLAVNPAHAALLLRLKGWKSPYVGLLDSPELAEKHIQICYGKGEDVGGWQTKAQEVVKRAELMLTGELERQRLVTLKLQHREFVEAARKAWKEAIEERRTQTELLNIKVSSLHEAFKQAKELTFDEWRAMNEA